MGTRHPPLLERRRLIEAWRTSGLSARAFAVQRGIAPETLRRWLGEADGSARRCDRLRHALLHRRSARRASSRLCRRGLLPR
jgi:hypothetical protein